MGGQDVDSLSVNVLSMHLLMNPRRLSAFPWPDQDLLLILLHSK